MIQSGLSVGYMDFPMPPSYIRKLYIPPPPPSRAGMDTYSLATVTAKDDLRGMLEGVSCRLMQVFDEQSEFEKCAARLPNTGRRRATISPEERRFKTQPVIPHDQRSASLELRNGPGDINKQIARKPLPVRPKRSPSGRPIGLRRPLLRLESSPTPVPCQWPVQSCPTGRISNEITDSEDSFKYLQLPPINLASPPISPTTVCFDSHSPTYASTDESDTTVTACSQSDEFSELTVKIPSGELALDDCWNWDEPTRPPDGCKGTSPDPGLRRISTPRNHSLRAMLSRPQTSSSQHIAALGSIDRSVSGCPLVNGEPRSAMDWDSSDDEGTLGRKLRVSFGKNSLKKSKIASLLRRNSGE